MADREDPQPRWLVWISRGSLVVGLVAMGVTVYTVGPQAIAAQLRTIGTWFAVILGIEAVATVLDATAIYALANRAEGPGFVQVLVAQVAGRAINSVTPGGSLGEATKASILSEQTSTNRAVAAVIYCGVAGLVVSLALIAIGCPLTAIFLATMPLAMRWALGITGVLAGAAAIGLAVLVRRGMVSTLADAAVRLHLVSKRRRKKWKVRLSDIDQRLTSTNGGPRRRIAVACVVGSRTMGWVSIAIVLYASGYAVSAGVLAAILSAGVVLGWLSSAIPLGVGVNETGNYALFSALGAPPSVGVGLALARRVTQLLYAAIGFAVLALWRLAARVARHAPRRLER